MSNQNEDKAAFRANITLYSAILNVFTIATFVAGGMLTHRVTESPGAGWFLGDDRRRAGRRLASSLASQDVSASLRCGLIPRSYVWTLFGVRRRAMSADLSSGRTQVHVVRSRPRGHRRQPGGSAVASAGPAALDYVDALLRGRAPGRRWSGDPEVLGASSSIATSGVGRFLLRVRDALVGLWGLKTASRALASGLDGGRIGIFRFSWPKPRGDLARRGRMGTSIFASRCCVRMRRLRAYLCCGRQLTLATVIRYQQRLGRRYFFVVAPFHRGLVKSALRRASRSGWPLADDGGTSCKQRLPGSDPSP